MIISGEFQKYFFEGEKIPQNFLNFFRISTDFGILMKNWDLSWALLKISL